MTQSSSSVSFIDLSTDSSNNNISFSAPVSGVSRNDIHLALVCQSNVNRSMEAHEFLSSFGYKNLHSYGTGTKVRLPGESVNRPNIYEFDKHSYQFIAADLRAKNESRYMNNGILNMIERDMKVKTGPERWQNQLFHSFHCDIVISFERRVFEAILLDLDNRSNGNRGKQLSIHLINLETTDNHSEATVSAKLTELLMKKIYRYENWQENIGDAIDEFELETGKLIEHQLLFG